MFSKKGRDPRESNATEPCRIVSSAFLARVDVQKIQLKAQDDAAAVRFFEIAHLPELAFDHAEIIQAALKVPG